MNWQTLILSGIIIEELDIFKYDVHNNKVSVRLRWDSGH